MRAKALQEPWVTVQPWPRPRTKPHITNSESGTRKPSHKDTNLSRGSNPKFLRNQEAQERPEEDAGKQCKGNECVQRPPRVCEPKVAQPKMPNGPGRKLRHLAFLLTPSLGTGLEATWPRVVGSAVKAHE